MPMTCPETGSSEFVDLTDAIKAPVSSPRVDAGGYRTDADEIIEQLQDGVAVVDSDLRVVWGNAAFRNRFQENVAGRKVADLITGPMSPTAITDLFAAARDGLSATLRFPTGDDNWCDLRVSPATAHEP